MSILLITHNLGVVAETAETVGVMYMGRIVERAPVRRIFAEPQHPYTRALLASLPGREVRRSAWLKVIRGSVPDPFQRVPGCPFHPRCGEALAGLCNVGGPPPPVEMGPAHTVACYRRSAPHPWEPAP